MSRGELTVLLELRRVHSVRVLYATREAGGGRSVRLSKDERKDPNDSQTKAKAARHSTHNAHWERTAAPAATKNQGSRDDIVSGRWMMQGCRCGRGDWVSRHACQRGAQFVCRSSGLERRR